MFFFNTAKLIYRAFRPIIDNGKNNTLILKSNLQTGFYISIYGNNNRIEIDCNCNLKNTSIVISGDNNTIIIGSEVRFIGPSSICMEGDSILKIGNKTRIRGVQFAIRNGSIEMGEDCMTSYGVLIRNHDSHKIFKLEDLENQINPAKDIHIGNHVWLCQNSTILKNVSIGNNSIVGFGSVVTKDCPSSSIVAGNPATIVKQGITWSK